MRARRQAPRSNPRLRATRYGLLRRGVYHRARRRRDPLAPRNDEESSSVARSAIASAAAEARHDLNLIPAQRLGRCRWRSALSRQRLRCPVRASRRMAAGLMVRDVPLRGLLTMRVSLTLGSDLPRKLFERRPVDSANPRSSRSDFGEYLIGCRGHSLVGSVRASASKSDRPLHGRHSFSAPPVLG